MSNESVAQKLGITRQAVHNSLKKSIPKVYEIYRAHYDTDPYETIQEVVIGLNIQDDKDVTSFYKYLTENQKNEIKQDMKQKGIRG